MLGSASESPSCPHNRPDYLHLLPVSLEKQNVVKLERQSAEIRGHFHCWLNPCHVKLMRPGQAQRPLVVVALTQTAN